ncbi:MAG: uracil-DNA glycosylase [Desulfurococcales archaeon]|nr:uracil-DNA glycosylase [Desulfurococcales archaeon]
MVSQKGLSLEEINRQVITCSKCPRLVEFRVKVAGTKARFRGEPYWSKPVPGYGDPLARIVVVGLAPAPHGGNRTGRVFTGDETANNLMRALYSVGLANQPYSVNRMDGLRLRGVYLTAAVKCAPPDNRPLASEVRNCMEYLVEELRALREARVYVALGSIAWGSLLEALSKAFAIGALPKTRFRHGLKLKFDLDNETRWLIASYHPSPRNVRTGLLTIDMLVSIFREAARLAGINRG